MKWDLRDISFLPNRGEANYKFKLCDRSSVRVRTSLHKKTIYVSKTGFVEELNEILVGHETVLKV